VIDAREADAEPEQFSSPADATSTARDCGSPCMAFLLAPLAAVGWYVRRMRAA
jgi:hypothetical protein